MILLGATKYKTLESCWKSLLKILQWSKTTLMIYKQGIFVSFSFLVILFFVLPSNFIVSGVKCLRKDPVLVLNMILFSIFFSYILIEGLSVFSPFLNILRKYLDT